jgi:hypothetical protein
MIIGVGCSKEISVAEDQLIVCLFGQVGGSSVVRRVSIDALTSLQINLSPYAPQTPRDLVLMLDSLLF